MWFSYVGVNHDGNFSILPAPDNGEVSVVGYSSDDNEGILRIYNPLINKWSFVCSTQWDDEDAQVACRQMGYAGGTSTSYRFVWIDRVCTFPNFLPI